MQLANTILPVKRNKFKETLNDLITAITQVIEINMQTKRLEDDKEPLP